jgi:diguanylate cyclase (GGDEF)-like protein
MKPMDSLGAVQALDEHGDAALTEDSHSGLLQWLTDMNMTGAVILVTLVMILGSDALTAALMVSFSAPGHWITIGLAIATAVPLVIAPLVAVSFLTMMRRLETAQQLIAELATTDMLTGIHNRRYFMIEAEKEFGKADRYHLPLSLILFDVDSFKLLNDTYGHSAGDDVLRVLSNACRKCLRASDVLARYGGEEFVILLPLTSGAAARGLAERIRRAVEEMPIYFGDVRLPVTISLGIADYQQNTSSFDEMLKEADMLLDAAKTNGRNRVEGGENA